MPAELVALHLYSFTLSACVTVNVSVFAPPDGISTFPLKNLYVVTDGLADAEEHDSVTVAPSLTVLEDIPSIGCSTSEL